MIRKKALGASVVYNFDQTTEYKIGWYAHFSNKSAKFIGSNWLAANDFIEQLPTENVLRFVHSFLLTSFTLERRNTL